MKVGFFSFAGFLLELLVGVSVYEVVSYGVGCSFFLWLFDG